MYTVTISLSNGWLSIRPISHLDIARVEGKQSRRSFVIVFNFQQIVFSHFIRITSHIESCALFSFF